MFMDLFFYLIIIVMLIVVVILVIGIGGFGIGGGFNQKYANKMMRYRLATQAVAVLLIVTYVYLRGQGYGG
jgi:hypoxia induced protein